MANIATATAKRSIFHTDTKDREPRPTAKMLSTIEAFITADPKESIVSIAKRAGVSVKMIYKYAENRVFIQALRIREQQEWGLNRPQINSALFREAKEGSAPHQRIFYQISGDLKPDTNIQIQGQIQGQSQSNDEGIKEQIDKLSPEVKRLILADIDGELSEEKKISLRELLSKKGNTDE